MKQGLNLSQPPTVIVRGGQRTLRLEPFTYCWKSGCVDGFLADPKSIGHPDRVEVQTLPRAKVRLFLTVRSTDRGGPFSGQCGRTFSTEVRADDAGRATIRPLGPAGAYQAGLFIIPQSGGDLSVGFDWDTPRAGPTNTPEAEASVLAHHDGEVDSYGVELSMTDLRSTPDVAAAGLTVIASNGARSSMDLARRPNSCPADGSLSFQGTTEFGLAAAKLGPPPFTYAIELTMDGVSYRGRAEWPTDVDPECSPCVPIRFTPPLPRLTLR